MARAPPVSIGALTSVFPSMDQSPVSGGTMSPGSTGRHSRQVSDDKGDGGGARMSLSRSGTSGSYVSGWADDDEKRGSSKTSGTSRQDNHRSLMDVKGCREALQLRSRLLCDNWRFKVLTTVLTIFALFGDDFRLSATHKRTDIMFDVVTIVCIVVFLFDIVASSMGQDGYFLGFFFILDVGSTCTLVVDLTWIGEQFFCVGEDNGNDAMRTSRVGRAGARASRTVRLIRLIRLVKLYKTYRVAMESNRTAAKPKAAKGDSTSQRMSSPGHDSDEDFDLLSEGSGPSFDEPEEKKEQLGAETRVGKKLSDMTTRRVIVLVLVMLFTMPQFSPSTHGMMDYRMSAEFGLEQLYTRWRDWCPLSGTNSSGVPWCFETTPRQSPTEDQVSMRHWYEHYLLNFLYYHHLSDVEWKLYWIGLSSKMAPGSVLSDLGRISSDQFVDAGGAPTEWNDKFTNSDWIWKMTALPDRVKAKLVLPWRENCMKYQGVSLSSLAEADTSECTLFDDLRCTEYAQMEPLSGTTEDLSSFAIVAYFDMRGQTSLEATLSMFQTIFICFAVGLGALTFSNDANKLLLDPIQRMMAKMEAIKDNPLEAIKLGDDEFRREEIENAKRKEAMANSSAISRFFKSFQGTKAKEPMETVILEKTIIKLGGLLALGFGEAGAEIIGANMRGGASGVVNAMIPGSKVDAIIGFASIRNFGHATEVLKEKVMLFVNQVGEIVHGCVDDYHGAPNKNIGDSFLLVWRLSGASVEKETKVADMAIMSFVKILEAINKSPMLAEYRGHPGLLQRIPEFRVQMGFGLHCGWAIEGAIGSEYKIDASYLSPNVNVAARLEAATVQFNVWILLSHFMINLCSAELAAYCRLIDHVTVKGSKQPIRLYTLDLDYWKLPVQKLTTERVVKNRFQIRQIRQVRKNDKWAEDYNVWEQFENDEGLIRMRETYTLDFFLRFRMAYRNYEAGEWMVARDMLLTCHYDPDSDFGTKQIGSMLTAQWPIDGPTVTLLRYMQKSSFCSSQHWPGHRELTEK